MENRNKMKLLFITSLIILLVCPLFAAGEYDKGLNFYKSKRYDQAKEMFIIAAKEQNNGNAYFYLGEMEKTEGKYREAVQYYEKAVNTESISRTNMRNAYWSVIVFQEQWNDYEKMVLTCKEVWYKFQDQNARQKIDSTINRQQWSENDDAITAYEKGMEFKKQSKIDEATLSFKEAIRIDSSFLAPKFELGLIALHNDDMNSAEPYLNAVISKIPYYAEASLALADVHFSKRKYSSAVNLYEKAEKLGFFDSSIIYHMNIRKAQCYYSEGKLNAGLESALTANKIQPNKMEVLTILSAIYIKQKDFDKAIETLRKAETLQPANLDVLYQMGSIYYSRKDERYIKNFDRIFDLTKNKQTIPYPLIIPILVKGHYEKKNYTRVNDIFASLEGRAENSEMALISAKSLYYTGQYAQSIEKFRRVQLNDDERVMLATAYVKNNQRDQARALIGSLYGNKVFYEKALREPLIAQIVNEVEKEKAEQERIAQEKMEQERKARELAEQEREARARADQERRAREKAEMEKEIREKAEREHRRQSSQTEIQTEPQNR